MSPPWSGRPTPGCSEGRRRLVGRTESFAEVLDANGRVSRTPRRRSAASDLLSPAELRPGAARPDLPQPRSAAGPAGRVAPAGGPGRARRGRRRVVVVGTSTEARSESLTDLAPAAAGRRAGRPDPRLARRLRRCRRRPAPGRGDAVAGGGDLDRRARPAPAGAADPRRGGAARDDAERDARTARRGARARAGLRRRRQPRAAHAAGDPADRAGARSGRRSLARGAARRAGLGRRGDRPAHPALRGSADDRPDRAGRAAAASGTHRLGGDPRRRSAAASLAAPRTRAERSRSSRAACSSSTPTGCASTRRSAAWSTTPCATAPGRSTLEASAEDGAVEIHVLDRGQGFPEEFLGRAFERFSRASSSDRDGGSGLGLAIVRTVARAHGGEAHAANREGGGADVWLTLPVRGARLSSGVNGSSR